MNLRTFSKLSLAAGLLSPALLFVTATTCGAQVSAQAQAGTTAPVPAVKDAATAVDQDPASQRVEQAKLKLDQARQQLAASKAMLKAAESEFKAARADKDALVARNAAQKLADASGLKDDGVQPVQPTAAMTFGGNRLYPATSSTTTTTTTSDLSSTRIPADFNAPKTEVTSDVKVTESGSTPDLRPNTAVTNEVNSVP